MYESIDILELKSLYKSGVNIIDFLTRRGLSPLAAISVSYDLQSGSYIKYANENQNYIDEYTSEIADVIRSLPGNVTTLMEAGVGEATTLSSVYSKLNQNIQPVGFDISLSRLLFAQKYFLGKNKKPAQLFVGDLFNIPLQDSSVDVVYTSHSIEPNGGREDDAISELFRVARKYLILLEPSYELANNEARNRMDSLGYVKGLYASAEKLGMKIIDYKLTKICANPLNPTALIVIEKSNSDFAATIPKYICPITKHDLKSNKDVYYSEASPWVYPVINNIPCMTTPNAIMASHYSEFL